MALDIVTPRGTLNYIYLDQNMHLTTNPYRTVCGKVIENDEEICAQGTITCRVCKTAVGLTREFKGDI